MASTTRTGVTSIFLQRRRKCAQQCNMNLRDAEGERLLTLVATGLRLGALGFSCAIMALGSRLLDHNQCSCWIVHLARERSLARSSCWLRWSESPQGPDFWNPESAAQDGSSRTARVRFDSPVVLSWAGPHPQSAQRLEPGNGFLLLSLPISERTL